MQTVTNGTLTYTLTSDIQVSAFLKNGYRLIENPVPVPVAKPIEQDVVEPVEPTKEMPELGMKELRKIASKHGVKFPVGTSLEDARKIVAKL